MQETPAWDRHVDALLSAAGLRTRYLGGRPVDTLAGLRLTDATLDRLLTELIHGPTVDEPDDVEGRIALLTAAAEAALEEALEGDDPLAALCGDAGLTSVEASVLACAVLIEHDVARQRIVGYLNDDVSKPHLTVSTLLALYDGDAEAVLAAGPGSGLRKAALIGPATTPTWAASEVRAVLAVHWWLVGDAVGLDPAIPPELEVLDVAGGGPLDLVVASGPDRVRRLQAVVAASAAKCFLIVPAALSADALRAVICRATLLSACVVLDTADDLPAQSRAAVESATHLSWGIVSATALPVRSLPRREWTEVPVAAAQADSAELIAAFGDTMPDLALTAEQLDSAVIAAQANGHDPRAGVRRLAAGRIDRLATRTVPTRGWDDLVLESGRLSLVRSVVQRAHYRSVVFGQWGMTPHPSTGVTALFSGESGTGKTMTAEIIAGELGVDLYRIDLSQMVSKYIGETEKNLGAVFDAAEASPVVLFFDEADALLSKRGEVSDAHDRYANLEVAYLLQRLERYNGVTVLATNLAKNIDPAFMRRIHVAVEFPVPEPAERLRIWQRSLPPTAPVDSDLDLKFYADRFELTGGSIRNAALTAAFIAAAEESAISMKAIALSVRRELQKLARLARPEDFGEWGAAVSASPG